MNSVGDTKTGNPKNLKAFIKFGIDTYHAKRNMVVIWGHGDGFEVAKDSNPTGHVHDQLFLKEIRIAIRDLNLKAPLDILGFNACQMGMLEVLHRLQDIVKISIASEGDTPRESWPYATILIALTQHPEMEPPELASKIVVEYQKSFESSKKDIDIDLTASTISKVCNIIASLKMLTPELIKLAESTDLTVRQKLLKARLGCRIYADNLVDLSEFCQVLKNEYANDPDWGKSIGMKCANIIAAIENLPIERRSLIIKNGVLS